MDIIDQIAAIPLFEGLPGDQHKNLAAIVMKHGFNRGHLIFSEGDEGNGFYVVVSGRVKIFKLSPEGKEQILHIFGPGEPFGEAPVFAGQQFPAYAEAIEDSRVLFFPRNSFVDLIKKTPSLALNMLAVLSARLRKFTMLVEELSLKEVPGRLATYLLYLGGREDEDDDLVLDISKSQLASLLGTIPETLSRILARMIKEGFVHSDGSRRIRILDREALEELARGERRLS
ncbi:MAG: Crp/Fnr family transcriptional regulator [Syntrophales bacterium]|nr:Crp/Fnr family transcriptional regulator [Syntrophales bacterium]